MSKVRSIRASEEEWTRWAEAAKAEGSDLTSWLRDAANEAANPTDPASVIYSPKQKPVLTGTVRLQSAKPETCARWMHHRKGTFCGSCNKLI